MLILASFSKDFIVTLVVGREEKVFKVASNMVLRSEALRERLKTYLKPDGISISIPQAEPYGMQLYLDFMHCGPSKITLSKRTPEEIRCRYKELAKIYTLVIPLRDKDTKNDLLTAILGLAKVKATDGCTHPPDPTTVGMIYKNTKAPDPMRKMMVDLWIPIDKSLVQASSDLPDEFMRDLLREIAEPKVLDSKVLKNVLIAVMGAEGVGNVRRRALDKWPDAYVEQEET
jgi:hypothetical protein